MGHQFHLLADFPGQVANLARRAIEKQADRDHPHGHGGALHFAGNAGQLR